LQLRGYQQRIVQAVLSTGENSIIQLPTGAGKTAIAAFILQAMLPIRSTRAVFLVPTVLLVNQQAKALRELTSLVVSELSGEARPSSFASFDALVATPKAFQMAQEGGDEWLSWQTLGVVVFDEVHHVIKDHPYRHIAGSLQRLAKSGCTCPLVLGLSASLTYAVEEAKVSSALAALCDDLRVKHILTASKAEMEHEGYHASSVPAEVNVMERQDYVPLGVVPESERKPHLMLQTFKSRLKYGKSTECVLDIFKSILAMEAHVRKQDSTFQSPISRGLGLKEWGPEAYKRIGRCAFSADLCSWYEALRLLVVSWEEAEDLSLAFLHMQDCHKSRIWPREVATVMDKVLQREVLTAPRFAHLKQVLFRLLQRYQCFRGIIFVQQRVATHILEHVILQDPSLRAQLRPACLYATSSPATAMHSVSPQESKARLAAFASGKCNLLIATVVAEEGMDIPEANCVIRFDPLINSVSLVQGRGRARQEESSFVVLSERADRPVARLQEVEQEQQEFVTTFQPSSSEGCEEKKKAAQRSRVRGAADLLVAEKIAKAGVLATLNLYCKKTKVSLEESYSGADGSWHCCMDYESCLWSCSAKGTGPTKKRAREDAAEQMLNVVREQQSLK